MLVDPRMMAAQAEYKREVLSRSFKKNARRSAQGAVPAHRNRLLILRERRA